MAALALATGAMAQTTEPVEGIASHPPRVHALVGARLVPRPGQVIASGTVVVRDGVIVACGADVLPPPEARRHDCRGLTVYPGLIEPYLPVAPRRPRPEPPRVGCHDHGGQASAEPEPAAAPAAASTPAGRHWNPLVRPELDAAEVWRPSRETLDEMRALGFGAALVVPVEGVFRGQSALVSLAEAKGNRRFLRTGVAQHVALGPSADRHSYPSSLMGAVALVRQTLLDASWHTSVHAAYAERPAGRERPELDAALLALAAVTDRRQPVCLEAAHHLDALRGVALAKELGFDLWLRASGAEYRRLELPAGLPVLCPVAFPEPPEVATVEESADVSLEVLRHWELAPENPARLLAKGVALSLTTDGLAKRAELFAKVRQAIERGLPPAEALRAFTEAPARLLGVADRLGTIEPGKIANLVVTEGDLFAEDTKVRATWIDGERWSIVAPPPVEPRGTWEGVLDLKGAPRRLRLEVGGEEDKLKAAIADPAAGDGKDAAAKRVNASLVRLDGRRLKLVADGRALGLGGLLRWSATVEPAAEGSAEPDAMGGVCETEEGALVWAAKRTGPPPERPATPLVAGPLPVAAVEQPLGAFGRLGPPPQPEALLVRGATLWTCGPQGKIAKADLLVERGKITAVGAGVPMPPGAKVIDAAGQHVTPGLIDAHSHTAIRGGVNEGSQAVTAEVRIRDVLDCDDVAIYRELAGGLTCANLLHGSANPIGGQMQVIKLRWGAGPEDLVCQGAAKGIKWALGENVKQSNWGDRFTVRYPQTRMGVEQILRDRLAAARDYAERLAKPSSGALPERRDLELEALAEVLRGERLVHCHSYRQDEVLMLLRVAEDFGFRIGTLQHILEGYKVGEAIAKHGAMASSFSDWWAYKVEVADAIPHNGAILHRLGVCTSFNSDSDELARRLNTEAAKAIKYGGVAEEQALGFVTLFAARQLRIDGFTGSLEPGKDADFVIWSGDPLSTYTRCLETWVDGRRYFEAGEDRELRQAAARERARLVAAVLAARDRELSRSKKDLLDKLEARPGAGEGR